MSGSHASFPFQGNYDPYDYGTHMPEQGSSNSNGGGSLAAGGGGGPGDKPSDDKRPRAVSKTIRACNNCRRQKMRCIGSDDPPCKRCRNANLECIFERPPKEPELMGESRVKALEMQMGAMAGQLADLVAALRGGAVAPVVASPPPAVPHQQQQQQQQQHRQQHNIHQQQQLQSQPPPTSSVMRTSSKSPSYIPPDVNQRMASIFPQLPSPSQYHTPTFPASASRPSGHHSTSRSPHDYSIPSGISQPGSTSSTSSADQRFGMATAGFDFSNRNPYPQPPPIPAPTGAAAFLRMPPPTSSPNFLVSTAMGASPTSPGASKPAPAPIGAAPGRSPHQPVPGGPRNFPQPVSLRSTAPSSQTDSRSSSDADDDLPVSALIAPLSSMHGLAEAAFASEYQPEAAARAGKRGADIGGDASVSGREGKRVKFEEDDEEDEDEDEQAEDGLPLSKGGEDGQEGERRLKSPPLESLTTPKFKLYAGQGGRFASCLDRKLITPEEARRNYNTYWEGADKFLAVFDPRTDTYEYLRDERPFIFSAICFVGQYILDGGGEVSDLQKRLWKHVRELSGETLFSKTVKVGAVQALILVSGWNDSGWLTGGHAVRLAMDVGCPDAYLTLLRTGMGDNKTAEELEDKHEGGEHDLVLKSRVWFCLYNHEHQMSYGHGRPPIVQADEAVLRARDLLDHPLSLETDLKLVSTAELMTIRSKYHKQLRRLMGDTIIDKETIHLLQQANIDVMAWYNEWEAILCERHGEKLPFYRDSIKIQRDYTQLFHNCMALRGIHSAADARRMSPELRALALKALSNAQSAIDICLRRPSYRRSFKYSVHHTHVCAAFAGSLLIRIARLFPDELDLRKTARDIENLARLLSEVPAGRYAQSLRLSLRKARARRSLPPPSAPSSAPGSPNAQAMASDTPSAKAGQPPNPAYFPGPSPAPDLAAGVEAAVEASPSDPGTADYLFSWQGDDASSVRLIDDEEAAALMGGVNEAAMLLAGGGAGSGGAAKTEFGEESGAGDGGGGDAGGILSLPAWISGSSDIIANIGSGSGGMEDWIAGADWAQQSEAWLG